MSLDVLSTSFMGEFPTLHGMIICTVGSLVFGFASAGIYMYKNKYSRSMAVTLVLLPAIVQIIIMLVNGNIGVGIAVAGAFSLIRFRSIPGTAREISAIFFAMAIGFIMGMGFMFYAFMFLLIVGAVSLLLTRFSFGEDASVRFLKVKIPENLDYEGVFDDIFSKYTKSAELKTVTTTNMGSLYELTYAVQLKTSNATKEFIDELRCRNGNLTIMLSGNYEIERL
ncbi:MAG: DUF4956 domain-containing protein [Treponema sp.]|jgi:hypothetical protein|nr:DUF4956 domain-containing protein [Treponema sp.]